MKHAYTEEINFHEPERRRKETVARLTPPAPHSSFSGSIQTPVKRSLATGFRRCASFRPRVRL